MTTFRKLMQYAGAATIMTAVYVIPFVALGVSAPFAILILPLTAIISNVARRRLILKARICNNASYYAVADGVLCAAYAIHALIIPEIVLLYQLMIFALVATTYAVGCLAPVRHSADNSSPAGLPSYRWRKVIRSDLRHGVTTLYRCLTICGCGVIFVYCTMYSLTNTLPYLPKVEPLIIADVSATAVFAYAVYVVGTATFVLCSEYIYVRRRSRLNTGNNRLQ